MLAKVLSVAALAVGCVSAIEVTVKSSGGNATSPYQYGLMFEDINNSGDGGVYAELIQNRAFQGDEASSHTCQLERNMKANQKIDRSSRATSASGLLLATPN